VESDLKNAMAAHAVAPPRARLDADVAPPHRSASTISDKSRALLARKRDEAHALKDRINHPSQVSTAAERSSAYTRALALAGRVGWCGKAVVYAAIGGLACRSAADGRTPSPHLPQTAQVSASPQVRVRDAAALCGRVQQHHASPPAPPRRAARCRARLCCWEPRRAAWTWCCWP
jgi:hypothetical protein